MMVIGRSSRRENLTVFGYRRNDCQWNPEARFPENVQIRLRLGIRQAGDKCRFVWLEAAHSRAPPLRPSLPQRKRRRTNRLSSCRKQARYPNVARFTVTAQARASVPSFALPTPGHSSLALPWSH